MIPEPSDLNCLSSPPNDDENQSARKPKTMSRREMLREHRRFSKAGELCEVEKYARPQTRAQCRNGPRPCLFVACKHHLYLDVNPDTGSIKINFPDKDPWELVDTCALDIAERGGLTLEEVGSILNLTRERVRQLEVVGLQKMKVVSGKYELADFVDGCQQGGDGGNQ
jgi:hypothetical protein